MTGCLCHSMFITRTLHSSVLLASCYYLFWTSVEAIRFVMGKERLEKEKSKDKKEKQKSKQKEKDLAPASLTPSSSTQKPWNLLMIDSDDKDWYAVFDGKTTASGRKIVVERVRLRRLRVTLLPRNSCHCI